jgi:hypothetical protein
MTTALAPYIGLDQVKRLVLDAVSSPNTRAQYAKALDDFFRWREEQGRPPFSRAAVQAHRAFLESKGYAASTVKSAARGGQETGAGSGRQWAARCRDGWGHRTGCRR